MAVYRGTAQLKAYKGDMQPVNVYKGSTKVAGWHSASYSGTSPLTVDCDYNVPPDALTITGKCVQTGTPSPDSPAPITTITGNVTITGADGAASDIATVAFGSNVCASLPDGTHDSYDAVTGVLTKRVGKVVFDGSADEVWVIAYKNNPDAHGYQSFEFMLSPHPVSGWVTGDKCISDKFTSKTGDVVYLKTAPGICTDSIRVVICLSDTLATDAATFKSWLASNPVTVYYALATPTTVQLVTHLPVVRTGIKTLSVGADVVPTLSATVKSMD